MSDGIGLAEALLGLDGFEVLDVRETPDELVVAVETSVTTAWWLELWGARRGA